MEWTWIFVVAVVVVLLGCMKYAARKNDKFDWIDAIVITLISLGLTSSAWMLPAMSLWEEAWAQDNLDLCDENGNIVGMLLPADTDMALPGPTDFDPSPNTSGDVETQISEDGKIVIDIDGELGVGGGDCTYTYKTQEEPGLYDADLVLLIKSFAKRGLLCELFGHNWGPVGSGDLTYTCGVHIIRPPGWVEPERRQCRVCGKTQTRQWVDD